MKPSTTAHHEAGHAVGAFVHRLSIVSATIEGNGEYGGLVRLRYLPRTFKQRHAHGIVSLCGSAAQRRFSPQSIRQHHASADHQDAVTLALDLVGTSKAAEALVRLWQIQARDLIESRWVAVSALAGALLERGSMLELAVREAIIEAHNPGLSALLKRQEASAAP